MSFDFNFKSKYSFSQRIINSWNSLPAKVVNIKTINSLRMNMIATIEMTRMSEADELAYKYKYKYCF